VAGDSLWWPPTNGREETISAVHLSSCAPIGRATKTKITVHYTATDIIVVEGGGLVHLFMKEKETGHTTTTCMTGYLSSISLFKDKKN
jgi:hypothetical protein